MFQRCNQNSSLEPGCYISAGVIITSVNSCAIIDQDPKDVPPKTIVIAVNGVCLGLISCQSFHDEVRRKGHVKSLSHFVFSPQRNANRFSSCHSSATSFKVFVADDIPNFTSSVSITSVDLFEAVKTEVNKRSASLTPQVPKTIQR